MSLSDGIQVVVRLGLPGGVARCVAFSGVPLDHPILIEIIDASPGRGSQAARFTAEVIAAIKGWVPGVSEVPPPCGGSSPTCHAMAVPDCQKVLVPFFAAPTPAFAVPPFRETTAPDRLVIPVLAPGVAPGDLPGTLANLNVVRWTPGDSDAAFRVLRAAGLGSRRSRLFVSYVRKESAPVAEQLFDGLNREGFEVFLDRFSIAPGVDFHARLAEAMSEMGTLLVLETRSIARSAWTRFEVDFARIHRLALLALRWPGGVEVPGVDPADRLEVKPSSRTNRLSKRALAELISTIGRSHADAERRRRTYLRDSIVDALLLHGARNVTAVVPDVVRWNSMKNDPGAVRFSNVPADLDDFHAVANHRKNPGELMVIAPGRHVDWRRSAPVEWLSREINVGLFDEGEIDAVAGKFS